jgi:uncharacterized protein
MFYFDPLYIIISLPALILGFIAQIKVKSAFNKYSKIPNQTGMTGARAARTMLDSFGLYNVSIERVRGFLSDHYDPRSRKLRLSSKVFDGTSISALGVASHECGHAVQHSQAYKWLTFRSAMVPTTSIGSYLGPIIFFIGFIFSIQPIAWIGIGLFSLVTLFTLITLPVEINASNRAKKWVREYLTLDIDQQKGIKSVLDAAALTYVASLMQAVSTLLYFVLLMTGSRRR